MLLFIISIILSLIIVNYSKYKKFEKDKQEWCNNLTENLKKSINEKNKI